MSERCKHCGKDAQEHNAKTRGCPGGRKNRTHGWPWFHRDRHFEPARKATPPAP